MLESSQVEQGSGVGDARETRQDLVLSARAVRRKWPVTRAKREEIIDRAMGLVASAEGRLAVSAMRVVLAADELNAKRESSQVEANRPGALTINASGPVQVGVFAQIDQYASEFSAAASRREIDQDDDVISIEDRALAGFSPSSAQNAQPAQPDSAAPLPPSDTD